jgi:hypothetical protein
MNSDVIPLPSDVVIHQPAGAVAASSGRVSDSNPAGFSTGAHTHASSAI